MKGKTVASYPHPYGPSVPVKGWTPKGTEAYANEKAWRKHSIAERQDRHHPEQDMHLRMLTELDAMHPKGKGGHGLEDYPTLRPMRGHVFARRRSLWTEAKAAGIAIPENLDRPNGQNQGLLYDVLAVGAGVTSVKVGDCVVANACHGRDMGDSLGDDVYDFLADVPYVDEREFEIEHAQHPDGSRYTYERRMSDCERASGGFLLAIVEE